MTRSSGSHMRLADGTPTCGSYVRTNERTYEESSLPERSMPGYVTRTRAYGDREQS